MSQLNSLNTTMNMPSRSQFNKSTARSRIMSYQGTQSIYRGDLGKYTLKQAGMTSIFKGIQSNDVEKITGKTNRSLLPTLRKGSMTQNVQEDPTKDVKQNTHKNLITNRKKYDELRDQVIKGEKELEKIKKENENLIYKENNLQSQQINHDVSSAYENDMSIAQNLYQDSYWQYKSYQKIQQRLKKDHLCYNLKIQKIKDQIQALDQQLKENERDILKSQQFNHQTQRVMEQMVTTIEQEQYQQEQEFQDQEENLRKQQEILKTNEEIYEKQKYISEHAMHDKDITEKKWRQLMLVHKFVNQMLKSKMDRELKKFEVVEKTFQNIKQQTGVSDGQEIVDKFLTREQTYGELLASISEYEKRIEVLQKQKELNTNQLEELKQEMVHMEMNKKVKNIIPENDNLKKLENVDNSIKRIEVQKERMYQWCIKTLNILDKIEKQNEQQQTQQEIEQNQKQIINSLENQEQKETDQDNENENNNSHQQSKDSKQETEKSYQNQQNSYDQQNQQIEEMQLVKRKKSSFQRQNYYEIYPREKITELLELTLNKLKEIQQNADPEDVIEVQKQMDKQDITKQTTEDTFYARNTRIQPKSIKKNEKTQRPFSIKQNQFDLSKSNFSQNDDSKNSSFNSNSESFALGVTNTNNQEDDGFSQEKEEQEYFEGIRQQLINQREQQERQKRIEEELKKKKEQQEKQRIMQENQKLIEASMSPKKKNNN